jgi:hypothetical protein
MGFSASGLLLFGACVFIPMFVIALAMLSSVRRAFLLSASFTIGGLTGLFIGLLCFFLIGRQHSPDMISLFQTLVLAAGAMGGGVLAVFLLGKLSKYPPWKRL